MIKIKTRNLLKKTACAALSVGIAFSYVPLNSYAMSNSSKRVTDSEVIPIDSIEPGQVFTTGTYEIQKDIEVIQSKPGGNGIEVQGRVEFSLNNHTVKITAGDAEGIIGGGAGVYVPKGCAFILDGKGSFNVKGGDGALGEEGHNGGDAFDGCDGVFFMKDGDGGAGGNGGGGAGAAIGTPGGEGGLGGALVEGEKHYFEKPYNGHYGRSGFHGANGQASLDSGDLWLFGDVKLDAVAGTVKKGESKGGNFGKDYGIWESKDPFNDYHTCTGGSGGGAGGAGYEAAKIGTGGVGGAGGGSGGTGTYDYSHFECMIFRNCGGGGGAGQGGNSGKSKGGLAKHISSITHTPAKCGGDSDALKFGPLGKGGCIFFFPATWEAGDGGNGGGNVRPSGEGGKFYCDKEFNEELVSESKTQFDGKDSSMVKDKIIRQSDCKIKIEDKQPYIYDGKPFEPKIEVVDKRTEKIISSDVYEVKYFDNVDAGEASIEVHGLKHSRADVPIIVDDNDFETCGVIKKHFTIKYSVTITGMKVKSKVYDGKPVEPVGEPKFTRVDDPSIIVKEKPPVIVVYYDEKGNLLKEPPSESGDYQYEIVVKSNAEKYTGSTGKLDFSILSKKNKH